MVNPPLIVKIPTEDQREWLLDRIDLMRSVIAAGEAAYTYDDNTRGVFENRDVALMDMHLIVTDEAWMRHFLARREAREAEERRINEEIYRRQRGEL